MRLIDADKLKIYVAAAVLDGNKEHKDKGSALFRVIDPIPTAYNVDKVVERLEKEIDAEVNEHFDYERATKNSHFRKAVEIVRSGGIE